MTIHAFKDAADGYYQCDIPDGGALPSWTKDMTPCDVLPDPPPELEKTKAKRQIAEIERETLMNRAVREFMLLSAEAQAAAQGITPAQLYVANPAYKSVKDADSQITELRKKLK